MKRPVGVIILCVVLALLSFAGFGNAYVTFIDSPILGALFSALALLYGLAALVALIGLWKLKNWAYKAFLVWAAIVMLILIYQIPRMFNALLLAHIAFLLFIGLVLWWLARYVRKVSAALQHVVQPDAANSK